MQTSVTPKYIRIIEKIFVTLFFVYALLGSNNISYGKSVITPVMWLSFGLGGVLLLYRLINLKKYITMTAVFPMLGMVFSIVVSTLANYRYSFKENVIICIYWVLFFFVLYAVEEERGIDGVKKDFQYVSILFVVYITLSVLVSFIMMFMGISEKIIITGDNYEFYKGFAIGRLWGTFINPNTGAISAAITTGLLIYFIRCHKSISLRIVMICDIIMQLFYIALSDSRTGAVSLGVVLAFYMFFFLIYRQTGENTNPTDRGNKAISAKKNGYVIFTILLSLLVGFLGFFIPRKTKDLYNDVVSAIVRHNEEKIREEAMEELLEQGLNMDEIEAAIEEKLENERDSVMTIDRGYDLTGDVSNRRLDAWKSAVEVFVSSPKVLIIGASFRGFTQYALENMPETYLVNNTYGHFTTLDNEIFNVMDAQGLVGLIALAILLIALFTGLFKYAFRVGCEDRAFVTVLISIVFGFAVSAMFCSVMFYHFSHNAVFFWVSLGSLMYVVKKSATPCSKDVEEGME